MTLTFSVTDRRITRTDTGDRRIVCDNDTDRAVFTFDAEWDGLVRTARFRTGDGFYDVLLEDGECNVPRIMSAGRVEVGVFGGDLVSTNTVALTAVESVLTDGGAPAAPTPDIYSQIISLLGRGSIESAVIDGEGDLVITFGDGTNINAGRAKGDTGATGDAGLTVTGASIDTNGFLNVTLSDGTIINAGNAKGEDGVDGTNGTNGTNGIDGIDGTDGVDGLDLTVEQTLTSEQKSQARENITAPTVDGYYSQMAVGTADNLAGKGDGVGASFIYRTTGGTADVADGVATIKSIKGKTIVWNQLVNNGNFENTNSWTGNTRGTFTVSNNVGTYTVTTPYIDAVISQNIQGIVGHKYLFTWRIKPTNTGAIALRFYRNTFYRDLILNEWNYLSAVVELPGPVSYFGIAMDTQSYAVGQTIDLKNIQMFDLTQMFGAGNEPSSVADFKALFPNVYYEYDAGSLLSFNATGIKTVGFNAFNGTYAAVLGGNAYYIGGTYTSLGFTDTLGGTTESITPVNNLYTPTKNGYIYVTGGTADTCINLSWSGIRNGEYEDYWTQTRNLPIATYFPNGMRRVGDVYDELTANKAVTRIGAVDLGSLTWAGGGSTGQLLQTTIVDAAMNNAICSMFVNQPTTSPNSLNNMEMRMGVQGVLYLRCDEYTDNPTGFKAAMSGVYLFYEMATPTEAEISTPLNLSYNVSDFGTEEIITAYNAETAPCNMSVVYGMNAVDFIRNAPRNYISVESFDTFAAALGAAFNVTVTKTWDSTNGKYTFTVAANE